MQDRERVQFLDGLRGIASIQVLLLHYCAAFLPAIGLAAPALVRYDWERLFIHTPLFLVFDGSASVYLFFLISGAALTYSFETRPFAIISGVARRVVRLGVPVAGSLVLAAVWLSVLPDVHVAAGRLSGSIDWLAVSGPKAITAGTLLREVFFSSLLTGHANDWATLLPAHLVQWLNLQNTESSYNGPIWSLHFEFYGSLFVMVLVACRSLIGRWHWVVLAFLLAILAGNPMGLFVWGHMLAPVIVSSGRRRVLSSRVFRIAGATALMLAGLAASYQVLARPVVLLVRWGHLVGLPASYDNFHAQAAIEGLMLFAAAIMLVPARRFLSAAPIQWLGRYSFSLYLVHFPILLTVASLLYTMIEEWPAAWLWATLAGIAVTLPVVWGFERLVDRPAIALSRRLYRPTVPISK
jgi:peptidoglycan/LPS O-acetylase OafA/YrhL